MVLAARPPFQTVEEMEAMLNAAADTVAVCVASGGGTGGVRKLQAWGADALASGEYANVAAMKEFCHQAADSMAANTPIEFDLNALQTAAAIANGVSQSVLTTVVSLRTGRFFAGVAENEIMSYHFNNLFYKRNREDCWSEYSLEGCKELAGAGKPDLTAWAISPDCQSCTADLQGVCQRIMKAYNDKFSEVSGNANFISGAVTAVSNLGKELVKGFGKNLGPIAKQFLESYRDVTFNLYGSYEAGGWEDRIKERTPEQEALQMQALQMEAAANQWRQKYGLDKGMGIARAVGGYLDLSLCLLLLVHTPTCCTHCCCSQRVMSVVVVVVHGSSSGCVDNHAVLTASPQGVCVHFTGM
jgi:hypothetical protein